jgi:peptidoglycan/LPS O-acetylase OafA/YrhL
MVRLGEISYAFYMIHLLVMRAGSKLIGAHPLLDVGAGTTLSLTTLAVAVAAAWLLHTAVELPGQQLLLGRRRLRLPHLLPRGLPRRSPEPVARAEVAADQYAAG